MVREVVQVGFDMTIEAQIVLIERKNSGAGCCVDSRSGSTAGGVVVARPKFHAKVPGQGSDHVRHELKQPDKAQVAQVHSAQLPALNIDLVA